MSKYLPKKRLEELDRQLSDKDKAILQSLLCCRYLVTGQIRRLHYTESKSKSAGHRAANWGTAKLRSYGLIEILDRRVGGVRSGSASYVWALTESGVNLLRLHDEAYTPRKRAYEPSPNFMKHTLEVSETYLQLTEICKCRGLELVKAEMEPACWRGYTGEDGKPASMKPDMFAVTANGDYEDSWFIEVDMNTESPSVVLDKCRRYVCYCKSGIEQKTHGVFPLVVWLVGSESRKSKLIQYITDCREMPEKSKGIFIVIMRDMFETLITSGIGALNEAKGVSV
ncbi:MAG: replication-relaxation family protein [Clostridiales bacterium]|jgi:hypothetical protein|nr:replication-relaxation family protein [Clostridiales bacterium]